MNDQSREIPHPPYDELRSGLGNDPAAARALEDLHEHLHSAAPEPTTVRKHVDVLRGVRDVEARIANWWDDPATQRWIKAIGDTGL